MAKTFKELTAPGEISAVVAAKTTLINTGMGTITLIDQETADAMEGLKPDVKKKAMAALFGIEPGESKALSAGTYLLGFQSGIGRSAVLVSEVKQNAVRQ